MATVVMPSDPPRSREQNENKKQSCDPNMQSSPPSKQEDNSPAAQTSGDKKTSRWITTVKKFVFRKPKGQTSKPNCKSDENQATTAATPADVELIKSIKSSIDHISKQAEDLEPHTSKSITYYLNRLEQYYKETTHVKNPREKMDRLELLKIDLIKLKLAVPLKNKGGADKKDPLKNLKLSTMEAGKSLFSGVSVELPRLHKNPIFDTSMELKEFVARYNKLEYHVTLCLLCFSVFPADAIIKKRLMVQWWVVEGYASSEEDADLFFKLLLEKGFIEAVNANRSLSVGSCRVHPFNRSALVALAERANFFKFGEEGDPTQNFSGCFQACLMGAGLISYEDFRIKKKAGSGKEGDAGTVIKGVIDDLEKLHLVMNVDEHILEFKHEWFGKMRNVNVLYLGRWKASPIHHIEVEDVEFLVKGLESMRCVKLLSFQGVSNIISLPDSILKLTNVEVLDLRACYNLESIPKGIGRCLERLTHLDMSECYLLNHMPKSLSYLTLLKVLKGFFVADANNGKTCTLGDLHALKKLEKLCIYTNSEKFPEKKDVMDLEKLEKLRKLTITWGVEVSKKQESSSFSEEAEAGAKAKTETGAGAEAKAGAEAEAEVGAEAEAEAKVEAGAGAKAKTKTGAGAEAKAEAKAEAEAEAEAEAGAEAEAEVGAEAEAKAEAKTKVEAEAGAKAEAKAEAGKLPASLEKLDLKCFPVPVTPDWLKLQNLEHTKLKKLYVRGGKFCDVGQYEGGDKAWKVEVLRLKYLAEIDMEWRRLQALFPKLKYLEQVSCPKLTFFPSDAKGVWINPE